MYMAMYTISNQDETWYIHMVFNENTTIITVNIVVNNVVLFKKNSLRQYI